jgi:thioesterase domain-containing protein
MVPAVCHVLDTLPLTPNGKVDRAALPDLAVSAGSTAPRSRVEATVARIVAEVLGVAEVGVHDDFFALGAHSLLLVRLAAVLRRDFAADVPVARLFTAPTVAGVARLLAGDAPAGDALDPVLTLHPGGDRPPLFCLAPASGLAWQFAGLKRYLPADVPLIGLQSPLLSGADLPSSLTELASDVADRVSARQPEGPIRLLGWSFGGALALCVAAALTARGREVEFVGMLDARRDAVQAPSTVAGLLTEMGYAVSNPDLTVAEAVGFVRAAGGSVAALTDEQIARVLENYLAADRLLASAEYPVHAGSVFFVEATVPEQGFSGPGAPAWESVTGGMEVHDLPVGHSELLDPAALERLGPLLAARLG